MKMRSKDSSEPDVRSPVSEHSTSEPIQTVSFDNNCARSSAQGQLVQLVQQNPIVNGQAELSDLINGSPRSVAQRKMIETTFGQPIQKVEEEEEEPVQLKSKNSPMMTNDAPGNETGMPGQLKSGIESLSGMDMSDVRVHRNSDKPAQLNALAYAQGNEIHIGPGQEQHLPHEAWHVVQQRQGRVKPTLQMKGQSINDDIGLEKEADLMGAKALQHDGGQITTQLKFAQPQSGGAVQLAFHPATIAGNAHLRADGVWGTYVGNKIDSDSEVVVDQDQQRTQARSILSDVTWTRAVNVTGANWDYGVHHAAGGYIRDSRINPKVYPQQVADNVTNSRTNLRPERQWNEQAGEYVMIENSLAVAGAKLIKKAGEYKRLTAANAYVDINDTERHQLDIDRLETSLKDRLRTILADAATDVGLNAALLRTDDHANKLMHPLRFAQAQGLTDAPFANWYRWKEGVFPRIKDGADHLAASLMHWKTWLHPTRAGEVNITSVELTGSDLHDEGLGAVFVTFTKPLGPIDHTFADKTNFKVVIKPEDRALEKALFGTEETSLASRVNEMAGLDPDEAITTFKMETSANYGAILEFVRGVQPDTFEHPQPPSKAMREAMVFAFIGGLSDLHYENVLWRDGKPYFIDADNAMNNARLRHTSHRVAEKQTGFSRFNPEAEAEEREKIKESPEESQSKIMQSLLAEEDQEPIIDAVRAAFAGKKGRVVPIATGSWAAVLKGVYIRSSDGQYADRLPTESKWSIAHRQSEKVPTGTPGTPEPGLEGEAGIAQAGRVYAQAQEAREIKADYDQGKIPFYNYAYDTGYVTHNGQIVWNGQPLAESLEILLEKFPNQRDIELD